MKFDKFTLQSLTYERALEICQWEYEKPYDVYSYKGKSNEYLLNTDIWGIEQFCLMNEDIIIGQVACQIEGNYLWVGWSLCPSYCGHNNGYLFIKKCIEEIKKVKEYTGTIMLRVAQWNKRAIKAYQKAGFVYVETIQDEIAYTDNIEDFWIMKRE